jgi:uncharacterized protein YPO0396
MKLPPYLAIILLALTGPAAHGQATSTAEWQRQHQQRQIQQQLDAQRYELQRLQDAQRRAKRDADYCEPIPAVRVPAKYPLPMQPAAVPTHITPAQQLQRDRYVQRVLSDRTLSHEAKMRLVRPMLNTPRP